MTQTFLRTTHQHFILKLFSLLLVVGSLGVNGVKGQTIVTLTSGSSWTVPANVTSIKVECYGGGGAGGGVNGNTTNRGAAGGGAGGAYARLNSFSVTPGGSISYSIGAGGTASGTTGNTGPGGDTWFSTNTTVLAKGGAGALTIAPTTTTGTPLSGTGATGSSSGSIGDQVYAGGSGGNGLAVNSGTSNSGGGGSSAGTGSNGNSGTNTGTGSGGTAPTGGYSGADGKNAGSTSAGAGNAATSTNYGAAGGGASASASAGLRAGGNGAQGVIVITYTIPTLSAVTLSTAISNIYGTAPTGISFIASGSNLSTTITATPQSGYEVSTTSSTTGFTATAITGIANSTTVYVRHAATKTVATDNSTTCVVLSSTGATSVNITTSASGNAVTAKGLTITGLTGVNKTYTGTTAATASGTAAYSGLVNGESFSVTGTPSYAFATAIVGTAKTITVTGFTAPSSNYTVTQPNLTADITTAPLTITGITADNKIADGTTTATISGTAAYSGLVNGETFSVTGSPTFNFSDANPGTGKTVIVTGYTAPSGNYSVTQPTLTADIITVSSPTITATSSLSTALTTTYGTASSTTTFSVSGAGLTNDIIVTPPSGFEVSISAGSGFTTSLTLAQSGGNVAATTIYIRLIATAIVGSYSGNIVVSSTGATSQNVATVSSTVNTATLTITGLTAANKTYDGTTSVSVSGTPAYSGLQNGESFSIVGTPSYAFGTASVGTAKSITTTGFTTPTGNYTVIQPSLTANITTAPLTITGIGVANKVYNGNTTGTITGTAAYSGLVNGESFTVTGTPTATFASANVGTGISVTVAGYTAPSANYSITQPSGFTANITQVSQTISFTLSPSTYTTATTSFTVSATATSGLTVSFASSNSAVATVSGTTVTIVGAGTTTITASQAGNGNYSAASDVAQTLTVTQAPVNIVTFPSTWSGTTATAPSTSQSANINGTVTVTRGAGLTAGSSSARYSSSNWPQTATLTLASNTSYLTFTITPVTGYYLNLNNAVLNVSLSASGTGPSKYGVYTSVGGFSSTSAQVGSDLSNGSNAITFPSSGYNNLSSVEIRIYGWNATGSGGTGGFGSMDLSGFFDAAPNLSISNTGFSQIATQNLIRNTTTNTVSRFKTDVTNGSSTLSSVSFVTPSNTSLNNYKGGTDINNFKLWYTTTSSFISPTQLGSTQTAVNNNPNAGGETVTFSGLSTSLPIGTYYFWITADVLATSTSGIKLTINAPTVTLSVGTVSGSTSATGVQTIVAGSATNYYLQNSTVGTASSWNIASNGSGAALSNIATSDINLIIDGISNATVTTDLVLGNGSKIIVGQNSAAQLTISNNASVTGTIDVGAYGTLVINNGINPTLGTVNATSTIIYNLAGDQTSTAVASYGNITLGGSGTKTLANSVSLSGTLTIPSGVTLDASNTTLSGTGSIDVQAGATLIVGNASGINGFNGTSGSSTYSTGANYTYNGGSSQVLGSALPSTVNNLTISNGNSALALGGSKTVNGALALSGGTKLVIGGSNTLTLNGTFSGTATSNLVGSATSNINIGGSGAVGTLRFDQTTNGTTNVLNNLVVNNSYTSGAAVSLGDSLKLTGTLTPSAGQLATGGYLTLLSTNEYNSAAIGAATGNTFTTNYITGNVTTQRYSQAQRGYRTLAHPFKTAQTLSQLTDNIRITGLTTGASGTYATSSGNPSVFAYNPLATAGSLATLTRLTNGSSAVWPVGNALYLFVRGAGLQGANGAGASNYTGGNALTAVTMDAIGDVNQGDVTVSLGYGDVTTDNFNLLGNPYPSAINLKNVTGLANGTIYVYNPIKNNGTSDQYNVRGGFDSYTYTNGSTDIIVPAMGGFYVKATGSGQSITFKETDKVSAAAPTYTVFGGAKQPAFSLKVSTASGDMDNVKFGFSSDATAASGDLYDAAKLSNSLFDIYSIASDNKKLTIDYRNTNALNSIIPLGIATSVANNFTISLNTLTDLPNTQLVLRDKLLKTETILSQVGDSYSFDISADTSTKGDNRFEIGLLGTTVLPVQIADITAQLQANKTVAVNWTSTTEVNLSKYNVQRSKDGSNFSTVGTVAAKGASTYNYNDDLSTAGVLPSTIYYRLEAVDKDGSKTYSKVVAVALGSNLAKAAINIYPNPVQATLFAQVTVTKAGAAQLKVVDAQGKIVATQKTQLGVGTTSVSIPAAQLAAGNYVLEIDSADGKQTRRFVKE